MWRIIISYLLIQTCYYSYGQSAKEQLEIINSAKLVNTGFYQEIPLKNKFGYFLIPLNIGGRVYHYIFDTGGYNTLTTEILSANELPELMSVEVGSSNQLKSKIGLTKIPSIKIGDVEFREVGALNFDFDDSPAIKCYTDGGLLGKSVIKNAVWQINSQESKFILTDDIDKLQNLDNAIKLKVKFDKVYNPFVKAKINGKPYTFLLDFGFGELISMTESDGVNLKTDRVIEIVGEGSISANGIVDESTFVKPIDSFVIGDFEIANELAYYAKSNNYNLIGTGITKYFIVTLNFKDKELYLSPIENRESEDIKYSFGFSLNRNDDNLYVSKIFKGGSAEQTGLKINDKVVSINGKNFIDESYCAFYDDTKRLLDQETKVNLVIQRGDTEMTLILEKKVLFK